LLFSVRIQHSRAARDRVIGSASTAGSAGLAACALGTSASGLLAATSAFGAPVAEGPVPSVSQAATASAHDTTNAKRANLRVLEVTEFIRCVPN
jgi:hypothetical protein